MSDNETNTEPRHIINTDGCGCVGLIIAIAVAYVLVGHASELIALLAGCQ